MAIGKNQGRTRVLLLAGSSALNLKALYCLYPVAESHVMATSEDNMALKSRHVAGRTVVPLNDRSRTEESLELINRYCAARGIDVVVPGDMGTTAFLAENRDALEGVAEFAASPGPVLDAIHDKWSFASKLTAQNLATPRTGLIRSAADLDREAADRIGFPMIVKPLDAESSHGVVRLESFDALHEHVTGGQPYSDPPLIMQEFIEGDDVDISVFADEGRILASAVQYWSPEQQLVFLDAPDMRDLAERIVRLFDFRGAAHFDMRRERESGTIYVVECNPRFWYTMPAAMWAGLNFVAVGIDAALGRFAEDPGAATGAYRLPSDVVRSLSRPSRLARMSMANWRGFLQPLLDPGPHIHAARARRRQAGSGQ